MDRKKKKRGEHLYKFIINWNACCLSEQHVEEGKGRGREERDCIQKTDKRKGEERKLLQILKPPVVA